MPGCWVRSSGKWRCVPQPIRLLPDNSRFRSRRQLTASRSFAARHKHNHKRDGGVHPIDAEHAAVIDTSSLRKSLDAIRAANRTRLIRKVDQSGTATRLSLASILRQEHAVEDAHGIESPGPEWPTSLAQLQQEPREPSDKAADATLTEDDGRIEEKSLPSDPALSPEEKARQKAERKREQQQWQVQQRELPPPHGGKAEAVQTKWKPSRSLSDRLTKPWLKFMDGNARKTSLPATERLCAEITACESYFVPREWEKIAVQDVLQDLQHVIDCAVDQERRQKLPFTTELVGSHANGLASAGSDIDINLVPNEGPRPDVVAGRDYSMAHLNILTKEMRRKGSYSLFLVQVYIKRAKVPIIQAVHRATGLLVQIQLTNDGFNTTTYAKSFVHEYPTIRGLFLVLRQFFTLRGLNLGFAGGITSYPLLSMIVASLKSQERDGGSHGNLAEDLLYFLDFWSTTNTSKYGVAVMPFELLPRTSDEHSEWDFHLYLRDPADPTNDLGKSMHRWLDVQATLIETRKQMIAAMAQWDEVAAASDPYANNLYTNNLASPAGALLSPMLEADYTQSELLRAGPIDMSKGAVRERWERRDSSRVYNK